ncbi:MAG TPA: FkbM family methyltransferase [Sinorhizobium sp.]|nr:FkbM family methyltransferase [Sinorhizobium sp.]
MGLVSKLLDVFSEKHVIASGEAAGLTLVSRGADPDFARGTYERPIQQAIASHLIPGDTFFDIGANIGFFSLIAARCVGKEGHVYAFEPVPRNANAIVRSAELNGFDTIRVFPEAIGATTGRAELLLARHLGGAALASAETPPDMTGHLEVDVTTLDDAIVQHGLRPPTVIKIDVEGAEMDAFRGMTKTLHTHRPKIIYEVDDATRDGLDRKARQIAALLASAGYALAALPASYPGQGWYVQHVFAEAAR